MPETTRSGAGGSGRPAADLVQHHLSFLTDELIVLRRRLHMHPETAFLERRTTVHLADRLGAAGLRPRILSGGTGLICDIGSAGTGPVALHTGIDALPIPDNKEGNPPYRSKVPWVSHACGHDVTTPVVLGAGLVLADLAEAGMLRGGVRLIFQPATESVPSGVPRVLKAGGLDGVTHIFGLHCDPLLEVGQVGTSSGPTGDAAAKAHDAGPAVLPAAEQSVEMLRETVRALRGPDGVAEAGPSAHGDDADAKDTYEDAKDTYEEDSCAEDFGLYLKRVPGARGRLGVRALGWAPYSLHQDDFDVDEACIPIGVQVLVHTALRALSR